MSDNNVHRVFQPILDNIMRGFGAGHEESMRRQVLECNEQIAEIQQRREQLLDRLVKEFDARVETDENGSRRLLDAIEDIDRSPADLSGEVELTERQREKAADELRARREDIGEYRRAKGEIEDIERFQMD